MEKKEYNREIISAMFNEHRVLNVVFIKENGEERHMICTQDMDLVPVEKRPKSNKPPSETSCNVWELDNGWRSFKYKSLIDVTPGEDYVEI